MDIVVTVAGILRDRMIFNMSEEEWDQVISVHLNGTYNIVRPVSEVFIKQRFGRIITFSSVSGLYGYGGQSNYGAAKLSSEAYISTFCDYFKFTTIFIS